MKSISKWASHHKWTTRALIVLIFTTLTFLGIFTGNLFADLSYRIPFIVFIFSVIVYFTALFFYPDKKEKARYKNFYLSQKMADFSLAFASFLMIVCISNDKGEKTIFSTALNAAANTSVIPKDSVVKNYKTISAFSASMKAADGKTLKWKERKKLLKAQIKEIRKSDMSDGGKTALIILSVLIALGLLALVASLACDLSCNGMEGAAILVGVGGTILIALLLIVTIRSIKRGKKRVKGLEE